MAGDRVGDELAQRVADAAQTALTALEVADMVETPAERELMIATAEREIVRMVELTRDK